MSSTSRTRSLVLCALSIALLTVGAFITVPFGPVPFTLQSMMLAIIVCLLTPKQSVIAVAGYLLLGAFGLPVFAGLRGGLGVLAGPTGGFLLGFLVATLVIAVLRSSIARKLEDAREQSTQKHRVFVLLVDICSLVILSVIYYVLGCAWFAVIANASLEATLATCVLPFVVPDILKAVCALICVQPVRMALAAATKSVA